MGERLNLEYIHLDKKDDFKMYNNTIPEVIDTYTVADFVYQDFDLNVRALELEEKKLSNEWRTIIIHNNIHDELKPVADAIIEKARERKKYITKYHHKKNNIVCKMQTSLQKDTKNSYSKRENTTCKTFVFRKRNEVLPLEQSCVKSSRKKSGHFSNYSRPSSVSRILSSKSMNIADNAQLTRKGRIG